MRKLMDFHYNINARISTEQEWTDKASWLDQGQQHSTPKAPEKTGDILYVASAGATYVFMMKWAYKKISKLIP